MKVSKFIKNKKHHQNVIVSSEIILETTWEEFVRLNITCPSNKQMQNEALEAAQLNVLI